VVRSAGALGVQAVIVGPTSSSPYLRRAVRNSMGGVFKLPILHVPDLPDALRFLRDTWKVRLINPDPHAPLDLDHADLGGNICIVLGNEEEGVSPDVRALPTERIAIRMQNDADSLNVASASAVFLYEARKRRSRAV
jgi:RNA methyltransferase, TrmH family